MGLKINGSTSGSIEIDVPAVAGTDTSITIPATSGGQFIVSDSAGDVNIDSGTLFVDSSADRVGIGATSPATILQIGDGSTGNGVPKLRLHRGSGSDYFELDCLSGAPRLQAVGGGDMKIFTSNTEHMRFRASGGFIAFNDGTSSTVDAVTTKSAGTTYAYFSGVHSATGPVTGGTVSLRIWTNGDIQNTNNSYGSLSDIKLKENIVDANSQWDDLKAVQVRNYNFKEETGNPTHTQIGVIAQELELVSPGLVYESPDRETVEIPALDENGDPVLDDNGDPTFTTEERETGEVTKSVNYSVLYMKAVKALQEAMERIETLETANASLEARLTAFEGGTP